MTDFKYDTLIFDIESDGLLSPKRNRGPDEGSGVISRVDCLCIRDISDPADIKTYEFAQHPAGEYIVFGATPEEDTTIELPERDDIEDGLWMLMTARYRIGHNIIQYDDPAIKMVYPLYDPAGTAIDTLVMTRLIMPDTGDLDDKMIVRSRFPGKLRKSHSLDAWGWRIGLHKGDYSVECAKRGISPWKEWRPNKLSYCVNDIDVTEALWYKVQEDMPPLGSIQFEHECQQLAMKQRGNGVPFDMAAAEKLATELEKELSAHEAAVKEKYKFWFTPDKKRINRPLYDDPDIGDRETPLQRKRKAAKKKGLLFDDSDYDKKTGYQKIRPEYFEDDSRGLWAEVEISKATRRAFEKRAAEIEANTKRENANARAAIWNSLNPDAPKKKKIVALKELPDFKWDQTENGIKCRNPDTTEGALFCPIKRVDFNPGSRMNVIDRLIQIHNWQPAEFTETGQPSVNDAVLTALKGRVPEAAGLAEVFFYKKLLGALQEGPESWMRNYAEDGAIHGNLNTGGTVSGRCAHNSPNLGNVVAVMTRKTKTADGDKEKDLLLPNGEYQPQCFNADGSLKKEAPLLGRQGEYGFEVRSLFYTPHEILGEEWIQIGADLKNVEGRTQGAQLAPYDDSALVNYLLGGGDIHTRNMQLCGINDRGLIKRVYFAFAYGAGDYKLGITADDKLNYTQAVRRGRELRDLLVEKIPGMKHAQDHVKAQAGQGFLIGIDGRKLQCRSPHSAFNLQCQSDAGLLAKKWWLLTEERLLEAGGTHGWEGDFAMMLFVHDELQIAIKKFFVEEACNIIEKAAVEAGEFFNYPIRIEADSKIGHTWAACH